jgi:hypothetical protein
MQELVMQINLKISALLWREAYLVYICIFNYNEILHMVSLSVLL